MAQFVLSWDSQSAELTILKVLGNSAIRTITLTQYEYVILFLNRKCILELFKLFRSCHCRFYHRDVPLTIGDWRLNIPTNCLEDFEDPVLSIQHTGDRDLLDDNILMLRRLLLTEQEFFQISNGISFFLQNNKDSFQSLFYWNDKIAYIRKRDDQFEPQKKYICGCVYNPFVKPIPKWVIRRAFPENTGKVPLKFISETVGNCKIRCMTGF